MVYDEHSSSRSGEETMVNKLGVNALLSMLCRLCYSKSFQSDNHIYCDLNDSTLDSYLALLKSLLNSEIVLVAILQLFYDLIHQVDY